MIDSRPRMANLLAWAMVVIALCALARARESGPDQNAPRDHNAQRTEFFKNLADSTHSPAEAYKLIKRRLLQGHFQDVKTALEMKDSSGKRLFKGYRFARLGAKCAAVIFRSYSREASPRGWATEKQGAELRRLAREATAAYEEAFRLAPGNFERACVYARWHELHTHRRFEADSLLLRSGSPLESSQDSNVTTPATSAP